MSQLFSPGGIKSLVAFTLGMTTLASSLLLSACQPSRNDGLKLGTLVPTTGDLASIGQNLGRAAELAVETINDCGGVNGSPVTLINEDSQTDPVAASSAMTRLSEVEGVAGVVGAFASSVSSAAAKIAARNQVMMISPGSTSPVFTEGAKQGIFKGYWPRTASPDTYQAQAIAALAHQKSQFRQVANPPGKEVSNPCQAMELIRKGEEINYQGASGNVDIDEYGDVLSSFDVWTVKEDGRLEVIDQVKPAQ